MCSGILAASRPVYWSRLSLGSESFQGSLHSPMSENQVRKRGKKDRASALSAKVGSWPLTWSMKMSHASSCCGPLDDMEYPPCCARESLLLYSDTSIPLTSMPMSFTN